MDGFPVRTPSTLCLLRAYINNPRSIAGGNLGTWGTAFRKFSAALRNRQHFSLECRNKFERSVNAEWDSVEAYVEKEYSRVGGGQRHSRSRRCPRYAPTPSMKNAATASRSGCTLGPLSPSTHTTTTARVIRALFCSQFLLSPGLCSASFLSTIGQIFSQHRQFQKVSKKKLFQISLRCQKREC